jgi:hypothetical protein
MMMILSKRTKDLYSLSRRWPEFNGLLLGELHRYRDLRMMYLLLSKEDSGVSLLKRISNQQTKI